MSRRVIWIFLAAIVLTLLAPEARARGSAEPLVIAGFDAARSGELSFTEGDRFAEARSAIAAEFTGTSFRSLSTLSAASLDGVDVLIVTTYDAPTNSENPLSADEQAALAGYVEGGGSALLLTLYTGIGDSLVIPFGMRAGFNMLKGGLQTAPVPVPANSPVTSGPHGDVDAVTLLGGGGIWKLGPHGTALASLLDLGHALAVIEPDELAAGSGVVMVTSDVIFQVLPQGDLLTPNTALLLNFIQHCVDRTPAQPPPFVAEGIVVGGFDLSRGGVVSFPVGWAYETARADLATTFSGQTFSLKAMRTLTPAALENVDILVIGAAWATFLATEPLSADEQTALRAFVDGGGCAILLTDNHGTSSSSNSMSSPFDVWAAVETVQGTVEANVPDPSLSPLTSGPSGVVEAILTAFPGSMVSLDPYAVSLATVGSGTALAVIAPEVLGPDSGPVVLLSDIAWLSPHSTDLFTPNATLFRNTFRYCLDWINSPPVAVAVCEQLTDIGDDALVRLDGSGSTDDKDPLSDLVFRWSVDGQVLREGPGATCSVFETALAFGAHDVTLRVTDSAGAFDELTKEFAIDPAQLAVLDVDKAKVEFQKEVPRIRLQGEIGLPSGVDYSELVATASPGIVLAAQAALPLTPVAFQVHGTNGKEWTFRDLDAAIGIHRFDIDWKGAHFRYLDTDLQIELESHIITSVETVLEFRFNPQRLPAPLSVSFDDLATVDIDAAGEVTSSVPFEVEEPGRVVTLTLPFALRDTMEIVLSGGASGSIPVADHLEGSIGRFHLDVGFDGTGLPEGAATIPRTLEFALLVGAQGYPGLTALGPTDLDIKASKWESKR